MHKDRLVLGYTNMTPPPPVTPKKAHKYTKYQLFQPAARRL